MPDTITIGHVLMLAGVVLAVAAAATFLAALRYRGPGHGLGTPGYAQARTGRRKAVYMLALGALLFAAGCFSPLCDMSLMGTAA
jgi:hypothetical protein